MLSDKFGEYYIYFSQRKTGWFVLGCAGCLITIGLLILSSASLSFIKPEDYFFKQLIWLLIGIPFFLTGCFINLEFLKKHATTVLLLFVGFLIAVLIPGIGKLVNGSRRWISLFGLNIQVSEFAKFAIIVWVAKYLDENLALIKDFWKGFAVPLAIPAGICVLILLEPDYGTAMLIGAVTFTLLFIAGTRLVFLSMAMVGGLFGMSLLIYLTPTRMRRIIAFMDVEHNKLDGAYQLWQGILGVASGGLTGVGLGQGRQQLVYLPEAHTDFIFSILSEELGSILSIVVLFGYFMFFFIAGNSARNIKNNFLKFISFGILFTVIFQVIINIGVVIGLLPTKGMVLPFMSYGGSNLVLILFMIGILLNCFSDNIEENSDNSASKDSARYTFS